MNDIGAVLHVPRCLGRCVKKTIRVQRLTLERSYSCESTSETLLKLVSSLVSQCSTGISSHHRRVAAELLLKRRQYIPGAEQLPGCMYRTPDLEDMGRLSRETYTAGTHVPVRRAER